MTNTISVRAYERKKAEKPKEYINTHLALFSRRSDAIIFAELHGIPVVAADDIRLRVPLPEPTTGGRPLTRIAQQLKQLVGLGRK